VVNGLNQLMLPSVLDLDFIPFYLILNTLIETVSLLFIISNVSVHVCVPASCIKISI
jgi:hypothetical protein